MAEDVEFVEDNTHESIEVDSERKPCWLVWSLTAKNISILHAICTTQELAFRYSKLIRQDENSIGRDKIRVWVEQTELNHLYAEMLYTKQI